MAKTPLLQLVGGLPTLQLVHKLLYDKLFVHPWLGKFFEGHDQQSLQTRQTQFMAKKMGGDAPYYGKEPYMAHRALYITDEMFDLRQQILRECLQEAKVSEELQQRWLRIDEAFRGQIVKGSIEAFYKSSWKYEKRVIIPRP